MKNIRPKYRDIKAVPNAYGGYELFIYRGRFGGGWWPICMANSEKQAREQMANLKRPVIVACETESESK